MLIQKNETAIQVLKILYSQNKKKSKKIKKTHYNTVYPRAIEAKYKTKLSSYFQPLIDYVNKFLEENEDALLRGDSMQLKLDVLPGGTFRRMITSLEGWLSVYMPTVPELKEGQNNVILMGLNQTAEQLKAHEDKQFQKQLQNGIGVSFQTNAPWWPNTKATWAGNNYNLIVSNARNYVNQINNLAEQAVVNGWSPKQLQEQIKKASNGLSDKKCRLLARDQIGKLQGQVAEAQMEEIGLEMYIWDTSGDERVRGNPAGKYPTAVPSHYVMDGCLCRWDNATLYSKDNGKTWIDRPANAVKLHPGQDIQCRCVALAYIPELLSEVSGTPLENIESPALYVPSEESEEAVPAINPYHSEEQKLLIQQNFDNALQMIEDEDLRNYVKNALDTSNMSNEDTRIIFYRMMKKMKEPYVTYKDWKDVSSNYKNGVIYIDKQALTNRDKKHIVHELGHAFAHLDDRTSKIYSLQKTFQKAVRKDYNSMLAKYNNDEKKLNDYIIQFVKKNPESYGGISDIFGGMQGKHLPGVPGHRTSYWQKDVNNIYEDAYADIFTMMFDTNASKVLKDFFPNSYNKIKKQVFYGVGGML